MRAQEVAVTRAARQPFADGNEPEIDSFPVFPLSVPYGSAEVGLVGGAQLGAGAAGLAIAVAVACIVAATSEAPHVAQGPDDRTFEILENRNGKETGADPVQMDNVGRKIG